MSESREYDDARAKLNAVVLDYWLTLRNLVELGQGAMEGFYEMDRKANGQFPKRVDALRSMLPDAKTWVQTAIRQMQILKAVFPNLPGDLPKGHEIEGFDFSKWARLLP